MTHPSEIRPDPDVALPPLTDRHEEALQRFVLFWGEMASNWGINRTMAQIHALLYASEVPLDTDEIMERLQISRGNANMNLRSLISWDLITKVHLTGSRKDFYAAEKDVWQITATIIKEREKRELRPVMEHLAECRDLLLEDRNGADGLAEQETVFMERMQNMMHLMEVFEGFSRALLPLVESQSIESIQRFAMLARSLQAGKDKADNGANG